MASTESLIRDLSADLAPVRRRSVAREAGALLALGAAELALIVICGAMRPDMGRMIFAPFMAWKIGSLVLLATAGCTVAIRSFAPPAPSRIGLWLTFALAALAMVGGLFVTSAADASRPVLARLAPMHGMLCALAIILLAAPLLALLTMLMRRAAPVRPNQSALATGLAAALSGALIFTACCPANDPMYIAVWYSVAVAIVTAIARWALPRNFAL